MRRWMRSNERRVIPAVLTTILVVLSVVMVANGETGDRAGSARDRQDDRADGDPSRQRDPDDRDGGLGAFTEPLESPLPVPSVTIPPLPLPTGTSTPTPIPGPDSPKALATGVKVVESSSSTTTDSISPEAGGTVLVWVAGLSGGNEASPIPTISGAGMSFTLVKAAGEGAANPTRRLSLFKGHPGSAPGSGPLTISFGQTISISEWFWSIIQVGGTRAVQNALYQEKDATTSNTVPFGSPTTAGNIALGGFIVGMDVTVVPGPPMKELGQATGRQPRATVFSEWTNVSVGSASCSWSQPAHSIGIAVEIAP